MIMRFRAHDNVSCATHDDSPFENVIMRRYRTFRIKIDNVRTYGANYHVRAKHGLSCEPTAHYHVHRSRI